MESGYAAPEQKFNKIITAKVDTFSLGITIKQLFTGSKEQPTPDKPALTAVDRLVADMLHEDPAHRPSLGQVLKYSALNQPKMEMKEVREIILELSKAKPDEAKLLALSNAVQSNRVV